MTQESLPPDLDIMDGLILTPLKTIPVPEEEPDEADVVVKDYTYIGSYNWIKRETPTIVVPGKISHTYTCLTARNYDPLRFPTFMAEPSTALYHPA